MRPSKKRGAVRPAGQIRQNQVVTTFGPGAMVDLTDHAVIIAGLDHWTGYKDYPIYEERLAAKVKALLRVPSIEFYAPPPDRDDPTAEITGITAWLFPEWFVAQYEERSPAGVRSRPLVNRLDLIKGQFERDRKKYRVVPVRFVQACTRGHVSDIDWRVFAHGTGDKCQRSLWMDERGTSGDLTEITIRCDCGKLKALSAATKWKDVPLGYCNGPRPWLGNYAKEKCGSGDPGAKAQINRLLIRSASNAYFAQTLSVISIPEPGGALREAVHGEFLCLTLPLAFDRAHDSAPASDRHGDSRGRRRCLRSTPADAHLAPHELDDRCRSAGNRQASSPDLQPSRRGCGPGIHAESCRSAVQRMDASAARTGRS